MPTSHILPSGTERFGLFAIIESTRVVLPLKGVEYEFSVQGGVMAVSLSQVFRQENPKPLDCQYLFPLPADASVYSCEADINGRLIKAEIKQRDDARKIAAEKKAEGFRTALVEAERDNLFTLELGNVQPDDLVVVRLKYFQTLRSLGESRSIEIPFCPGVRYIPGKPLLRSNTGKGTVDDTDEVPEASRISPVRIDAGHPDAAYIEVSGRVDGEFLSLQSLVSPSHAITVAAQNGQVHITLASKGEVPDRDFVLRWDERVADAVAPRAWAYQKGIEHYALLEVRAPHSTAAHETALDFYFLVDRSGSMGGTKWDKAIAALHSCVAILGPGDRAMVTLFASQFQDFAEQPLPGPKLLADPQFQNLKQLGAAGGTEMAPALKHVLDIATQKSAGRERNLILITDAQIGNETAILDLMKTAPDMAVHCFGIDIALNDALLLALARQQGGTFHSLHPNDDIPALVTKVGKTLRQPVLGDLRLSAGWLAAEAKIPNLYAGQILYLSAKCAGALPLELSARTPAGEPWMLRFQSQPSLPEAPYLHWCKARIQRLLAENRDTEAVALSVASNLLCRLTAFIAWDESEKVAVSRHELVQPSTLMDEAPYSGPAVGSVLRCGLVASDRDPISLIQRLRQPDWDVMGTTGQYFMTQRSLPDALLAQLLDVCRKINGNDWQPHYQAISQWFSQATPGEVAKIGADYHQLIRQLDSCVQLLAALNSGGSKWMRQLENWRQQFRMFLQQWNANGELKDLETVFHEAEQITNATPAEKFIALSVKIQQQAVETLKRFTDHLPVRR